jgi:bloom syndrome protein
MARLRAAPNSATRPGLVTQNTAMSTQTPRTLQTLSVLHQHPANHAVTDKFTARNTQPSRQASPIRTSKIKTSPHLDQSINAPISGYDVEAIDLTGDSRQYRIKPAGQQQAGRKRKSDEMNASPSRRYRSPKLDESALDGFTSIDDIYPSEPPPAYSTAVTGPSHKSSRPQVIQSVEKSTEPSRLANESVDNDARPVTPADDYEETSVTEIRMRTETTRKRKSLTRTTSEIAQHQEKPTRRRLVADSEDDEDSAPLETQAPLSSTTELSVEETTVIRKFLEWPEDGLTVYEDRLLQEIDNLGEKAYAYFTEHGEQSSEIMSRASAAREKKAAVSELQALRSQHIEYTGKKKHLKIIFMAAFDKGVGLTPEEAAENKKITTMIHILEADIARLLRSATLFDLSNATRSNMGTNRGSVVVRSTQVTPAQVVSRKAVVPDSSLNSYTQRVHQTQIEVPGTPTRRLQMTKSNFAALFSPSSKAQNQSLKPEADRSETTSCRHSAKRASDFPTNIHQDGVFRRPAPIRGPQAMSYDDHNLDEEEFGADDDLFCDNMGGNMNTPPGQTIDDYEFENIDEDMLLAAEEFDNVPKAGPVDWKASSRNVFGATSANTINKTKPAPSTQSAKKSSSGNEAALMRFPWSQDVKATLRDRFHLRGFRQNQLEAINGTLGGKDVFVLMPTGGGKSLCYQLPALITSGKTRGVTIVISPLLSLMEDQVQHLQDLNVQAFLINSESTLEQRQMIFSALKEERVEEFVQLLYVTPEMLTRSNAVIGEFERLNKRNRLARLVIDEAHCVSQWGHDFRPDYKQLGEFRRRFPRVPVMALTATATENVKVDVIHNLGIDGCEEYKQSFNRPNLSYDVRSKGTKLLESIASIINGSYKSKCGIIYCLARKKCEDVAKKLREDHGIKAHHYHAAMEPAEKRNVQQQWQKGFIHVIVATIAFGMGIDKADVRFVIHHSIPKSLEGYYQETGRAGRDGLKSGCYLFFGYQDFTVLKRMIDDGEGNREQKERQLGMLQNVVNFCNNKSDCRRVQVLRYFSERFTADGCNGTCDNCNSTSAFEKRDMSKYVPLALSLVKEIQSTKVTLLYCVDLFRGVNSKKARDADHTTSRGFGAGKDMEREDAERFFQRLLTDGALAEENKVNKMGFATQYIEVRTGSCFFALLS